MARPAPESDTAPPLDRLRLQHVRCFAEAEIPIHPRVTVILGENGSGKTTIAEAIASLASGEGEGLDDFPARHGTHGGTIALFEAGAAAPIASWSHSGERIRLPADRSLFAYGRYRRVQFPDAPKLPFAPFGPEWKAEDIEAGLPERLPDIVHRHRTTTLFRPDNHLLRDLARHLVEIHQRRSDPRMDQAWILMDRAVAALGLSGLGIASRGPREVALIRRGGLDLTLSELSDGYQAILVIVLDLVLRFVFLSPPLADPSLRRATVIIDEVDLHLHPRWQRLVVRQLTRLFPEVQWILTTHSPAVVQGAIDDGHAVLRMREDRETGATQIDALDERERNKLRGAQLGSVLVDDALFDAPSRFSERYRAVEKRVRRLRRKLERGEASREDRDELLQGLDQLEVLMADEERRWAKAVMFKEITKVQIASLKELARLQKEMEDGQAPPREGG